MSSAYDCMYLISKQRYEALQSASPSAVDGVGGDAHDSTVNNIEVSGGGTVVIGGGDVEKATKRKRGASGASKAEIAREEEADGPVAMGEPESAPTAPSAPSPSPSPSAPPRVVGGNKLAAPNPSLERAGARPTAFVAGPRESDLRRRALANAQKEAVRDLVSARLRTLQGGHYAGESDAARERRIVHELREQHRRDLREQAARQYQPPTAPPPAEEEERREVRRGAPPPKTNPARPIAPVAGRDREVSMDVEGDLRRAAGVAERIHRPAAGEASALSTEERRLAHELAHAAPLLPVPAHYPPAPLVPQPSPRRSVGRRAMPTKRGAPSAEGPRYSKRRRLPSPRGAKRRRDGDEDEDEARYGKRLQLMTAPSPRAPKRERQDSDKVGGKRHQPKGLSIRAPARLLAKREWVDDEEEEDEGGYEVPRKRHQRRGVAMPLPPTLLGKRLAQDDSDDDFFDDDEFEVGPTLPPKRPRGEPSASQARKRPRTAEGAVSDAKRLRRQAYKRKRSWTDEEDEEDGMD